MRALIQRVSRASVTAPGHEAAIGRGLVVLLGVRTGDTPDDALRLARKSSELRIFEDDQGKMNRSLLETEGDALVVSQFTLYGNTGRGRRPSFTDAAPPEEADRLYREYVRALGAAGVRRVETGVFQAMMTVTIVNEGPVTLMLESRGEPGGGPAGWGGMFYTHDRPLVLASASPRRVEILRQAGIPVVTSPVSIDEGGLGDAPPELSRRLAREKALAAAPGWPGRFVLAADTVVDLEGTSLGKPAHASEARKMLTMLSGRRHEVHTALCLIRPDGSFAEVVETTGVVFRDLAENEIATYVKSGEPMDKAGAYGIQGLGRLLVKGIEGSYDNVVGLPLYRVLELLELP
jgi:MAF protein/D-tyrosyl-tRNA(Tyr) deacylase